MNNATIIDALQEKVEETKQTSNKINLELETYPYINYLDRLEDIYSTKKEFICKGLHQYKENKGKWICQCGKKL